MPNKSQRGQVIVEYVLLLTIAVTLAMIVITSLVKRDGDDPENSGALIKQWQGLQRQIGEDLPP